MGTRSLICVVLDGQFKVAQYGHSNGFPAWTGLVIWQFIKNHYQTEDWDIFRNKVRACSWISEKAFTECGGTAAWMGWPPADFETQYPELGLYTGGWILDVIYRSPEKLKLYNYLDFAAAIMCAWCYVLDLDANQLEVYRHSCESLTEQDRFFFLQKNKHRPVKCLKTFAFAELECQLDELLALDDSAAHLGLVEERLKEMAQWAPQMLR